MSWVGRVRQATASDFVRKIAETFATRVFGLAIGVITSMIIARILGPDGRGLYALAGTIAGTATQFGNLGLHAFNTYRVAQDKNSLPALLGNSLAVSAGAGALLMGIVLAIGSFWPTVIPIQGWLLALMLLTIPLGLATLFLQNLLLGLQQVRAYNTLDLTNKVLAVALVGIVIALQAVTVTMLYVTGIVTTLVMLTLTLRRLAPHLHGPIRVSIGLLKAALPYGSKAYLSALFSFLVLRADLFMIQGALGVEQVGYYSVASALIDMIYMLPVVIGTILFPRLSAMTDDQERWTFTKRTAGFVALLMGAGSVAAAVLAKPVIGLLYGAAFLPAAPAFIGLLPGIVAMSVNTILMNYFASMAMPPVVIYSPLLALVTNVGLNLWLIPAYGIWGAAVASSIAYGLMLVNSGLYIAYRRRRLP